MKDNKCKYKVKVKTSIKYPSAELIQTACYEDYRRCLETYDKIYEKINIALAFCGAVLIVILSNIDFEIINKMKDIQGHALFFQHIELICILVSTGLIVWSVVQLLLLMRSQTIYVFDSIAARNEEVYDLLPNEAALWLIDNYTFATNELREINNNKHEQYNSAIIRIVVSLLAYSVTYFIK